jgi:hypothetical protein
VSPAELRRLAAERTHVSVAEAAEILGVPRSTAYASIKAGTFPVEPVPVTEHRWIIPTAHLLRVLGLDPPEERRLRAVP